MARVLAVVAHPDDEVLGCGGVLALHADRGDETAVLILGEGMRAREVYEEDAVEALRVCARESAKILGVQELRFAGLPDNRFDSVALLDVVKIVEQATVELRPTVVYTHHGGDLNVDHAVAERAVLTALRPLPEGPAQTILAFETLSSTEWSFGPDAPPFRPQWFVDIEASLERKLAALRAYTSEVRPWPHPRSPEAVEASARRWGTVTGVACAEAFAVLRIGPGPLPG